MASEKLMFNDNDYYPSNNLPQRIKQEIYDGILTKQKELANDVYIVRCKEKDL